MPAYNYYHPASYILSHSSSFYRSIYTRKTKTVKKRIWIWILWNAVTFYRSTNFDCYISFNLTACCFISEVQHCQDSAMLFFWSNGICAMYHCFSEFQMRSFVNSMQMNSFFFYFANPPSGIEASLHPPTHGLLYMRYNISSLSLSVSLSNLLSPFPWSGFRCSFHWHKVFFFAFYSSRFFFHHLIKWPAGFKPLLSRSVWKYRFQTWWFHQIRCTYSLFHLFTLRCEFHVLFFF